MNKATDFKQNLRRQMRQARRSLTPAQQRQHAHGLLATLRRLTQFRRSRTIALYLASDGEISAEQVIDYCRKQGKQCFLPVLHPVRHNRLWFIEYKKETLLTDNIYGIKEPSIIRAPRRPAWALDLVLLPLVAFDNEGGRLGMGGGYYDRTFAFKQSWRKNRGTRLIGLAHDLQKVDQLTTESWDIPLEGVATEQRFYNAAQ
ncbi:5-formyltetrahydrofolate cyclo-ligase [Amphritea pacifica]|uniref:5-formyltetrahydrofolate cyclo-ligase n=1 Tax=Amphritea pacifica TaxID=2811233 RepID=A0ABS2W8M5_9GAMM|nr:5-formyltetrahydrofolate cyclo-ligase [Amphritea pacifica]MBN0988060.1 5-formyltetrahydrofolate cyclo-ligase [Amphritea pacifica]MBN1006705.1 5-formyltetrahydrofolate cyclo-ligase [Amphritea pacifica]